MLQFHAFYLRELQVYMLHPVNHMLVFLYLIPVSNTKKRYDEINVVFFFLYFR